MRGGGPAGVCPAVNRGIHRGHRCFPHSQWATTPPFPPREPAFPAAGARRTRHRCFPPVPAMPTRARGTPQCPPQKTPSARRTPPAPSRPRCPTDSGGHQRGFTPADTLYQPGLGHLPREDAPRRIPGHPTRRGHAPKGGAPDHPPTQAQGSPPRASPKRPPPHPPRSPAPRAGDRTPTPTQTTPGSPLPHGRHHDSAGSPSLSFPSSPGPPGGAVLITYRPRPGLPVHFRQRNTNRGGPDIHERPTASLPLLDPASPLWTRTPGSGDGKARGTSCAVHHFPPCVVRHTGSSCPLLGKSSQLRINRLASNREGFLRGLHQGNLSRLITDRFLRPRRRHKRRPPGG